VLHGLAFAARLIFILKALQALNIYLNRVANAKPFPSRLQIGAS